jgi:hypothetical protein
MKYHVRYYDAKLSKKGKGTQVAAFKTRAEAEDFAGRNQIYSGPCRVELVAEEGDEAKLLAMAEAEEHATLYGFGFVMLSNGRPAETIHPSRVHLKTDGSHISAATAIFLISEARS